MRDVDLFNSKDAIRILNAVAHAGAERGPEYHLAIEHIAIGFGVQDELDPLAVEAGYRVNDDSDRD